MPIRESAWPEGTPCWVDLQVDDVTAARAFYSDLFGWEIFDGPEDAGGYVMALKNGKPAAGIGPKMGQDGMPNVWTTYIAADSADAVTKKISEAGGMVFAEPFDVLDVGRMAVAADPSGAVFGVWESKLHTGANIYNENGAYVWNEVHTLAYDKVLPFYESVFGYTYENMGAGEMTYTICKLPGESDGIAGIADMSKMGAPASYWLAWFQVDDLDDALAKATAAGSSVMMGPEPSAFGRMAIIAGPQGEVLGLINTKDRAGA